MSIYDYFNGNATPEQTSGLMGLASAFNGALGDGRQPVNFGQALSAGAQGMQQGRQQYADREREKQLAEAQAALQALKLRAAQGDLQAQEQAAAVQQRIQQAAQGASIGGQFDQDAFLNSVQQSDPLEAIKLRQQLAKAAPKFDSGITFVNGPDGKPVAVRTADDGSIKQVDGIAPREKLEFRDGGGQLYGLDGYSGEVRKMLGKTMTPEGIAADRRAAASNAIAMRGQDMTDRRARDGLALQAQKEKAPTEFQGKSAAFGARAAEADKTITALQGKYSPARVNAKMSAQDFPLVGGLTGAVANKFLTDEEQSAEQAQRDFINAVLRQESGAAIGESEFTNARRQYFPQPGDSASVIQQKAKNRALSVQGLNNNAGRAAFTPAAAPAGGGVKFLGFE